MTFPAYFEIFGRLVHPHPVLELIGYATGSQVFLWRRRRSRRNGHLEQLAAEDTAWIFAAMLLGALVGAFGLAALEHVREPAPAANVTLVFGLPLPMWVRGKTIVGGLLGGWIGIELAKRVRHLRVTTGDLFVLPLAAGIFFGRTGCFLTGLEDGTYGTATTLPWGVDFGDGIARHPTQLYEAGFVLVVGVLLSTVRRKPRRPGLVFREFLAAYLAFRVAAECVAD